jgi:hypothetical protein
MQKNIQELQLLMVMVVIPSLNKQSVIVEL